MKLIKPIVGISKIIDNYDAVICGFSGVLSKGSNLQSEALYALLKSSEAGKHVVVVSNSALRVARLVEIMGANKPENLSFLNAVITAGEILHYRLKNFKLMGLSGKRFYNLGNTETLGVFSGLDFEQVKNPENADFAYIGGVRFNTDTIDSYRQELEHLYALGLPLLCVGNDVSTFMGDEISLGSGAVAEQYAVMGGKIITFGKPDTEVLKYVMESFSLGCHKVLFIGDSFPTDIKSGSLLEADTVLISKGIHVNFLGEGYIPDVEKTRNLAMNFDVYPDYVISGLRW